MSSLSNSSSSSSNNSNGTNNLANSSNVQQQFVSGEQFSLVWNTFPRNLSSGLYNLLAGEQLVDVTLAAEGQILRAHKLILSVCSTYFRDLFKVRRKNFVIVQQNLHACVYACVYKICYVYKKNSSFGVLLLSFIYTCL